MDPTASQDGLYYADDEWRYIDDNLKPSPLLKPVRVNLLPSPSPPRSPSSPRDPTYLQRAASTGKVKRRLPSMKVVLMS